MIILTAGHTGPNSGATGTVIEHHGRLDEGTETIRLRNRIAEILTEKWGIVVLLDRDNEHLGLLTERINRLATPTDICLDIHLNSHTKQTANGTEVIIADDAMADGEHAPIDMGFMRNQLDIALEFYRSNKVDGLVFHCTPLVNKNLEAVEYARSWLDKYGDIRR